VLELLHPFKPFNLLTDREMEVLSLFLVLNYDKREIPYDDRMRLLFSYEIKSNMIKELGISNYNYHNLLKRLRDKGFITVNSIDKKFLFDTVLPIQFNLSLDDSA